MTKSYLTGVIALVFLIIGYQTALFVHRAAVMKIAADRDEPDTVYVIAGHESRGSYESSGNTVAGSSDDRQTERSSHLAYGRRNSVGASADGSQGADLSVKSTDISTPASKGRQDILGRKNANHSPHVQAVRKNLPVKKVASFRFNPNTASIEDLCLLGFTPKQAQSIENYRAKGGRFRRKSDFAKSYVVSDSIYRRLEPYIDIPQLDLNLADSADFDALPGIGPWFASSFIRHRKALGGFSYKEQLMDVRNFTPEKFELLSDLVCVNVKNSQPYQLWTLPADSLRCHPYIRKLETARSIVLFRENTPKDRLSVGALSKAGILPPEDADRLLKCLIEPP